MDAKTYEFKPLYKTQYASAPGLINLITAAFVIIFIYPISKFHLSKLYLLIPTIIGLLGKTYKDSARQWDIDGYELIKIDGHTRCVFLDDLAIPFSEINYAEVFFDRNSTKNWMTNCGVKYFSILKATICFSLKNGDYKYAPVQLKPCLRKLVATLKDYVVVKYNPKDEPRDEGITTVAALLAAVIIALAICSHFQ